MYKIFDNVLVLVIVGLLAMVITDIIQCAYNRYLRWKFNKELESKISSMDEPCMKLDDLGKKKPEKEKIYLYEL